MPSQVISVSGYGACVVFCLGVNKKLIKIFGAILIFVLILLLFVSSPAYFDDRLFKEFWETGHFILFTLLVFFLLHFKTFKSIRWIHLVWITTLFSFSTGLAIEILQLFVDRSFSLIDVANDIVGGLAGLILFQLYSLTDKKPLLPKRTLLTRYVCYVSIFFLLSSLGSRTFIMVLIDQVNIKNHFPILSNFETPFEIERWGYRSATLSLSDNPNRQGSYAMKIVFSADQYPDVTLKNFVVDWSSYNTIGYSLFNTERETIEIAMKVYDNAHMDNGYRYNDRFNRIIHLKPGWNDLNFLLDDIKNAPRKRQMNMKSIRSFSLFMIDLERPVTLYLDNLHLANK